MQLAITALGSKSSSYLCDVLSAITNCKCNVVELRNTQLSEASAAYFLIEGNWNHIAKLENLLDTLQVRLGVHFQSLRPESIKPPGEGIPYLLETMSIYRNDVIQDIATFLAGRSIGIEEISASRFPSPYCQSTVFSTRFIVTIPAEIRLLSFREEFLDFCDNLNLDAILEPIKR